MNYIVTSILSLFFVISSIFSVPFDEVEAAFVDGNANKIMSLGTTKVLISIKGNEGIYSKSQGAQVLSGFFKNNPPESFSFNFKGKDSGAATFGIGEYKSGKSYRVSIKFKKVKETHQIESITIVTSK